MIEIMHSFNYTKILFPHNCRCDFVFYFHVCSSDRFTKAIIAIELIVSIGKSIRNETS